MKQNERLCWRHSDDLTILLLSPPTPTPPSLLYVFIFIFTSFTHLTPTLIHITKLFLFSFLYTIISLTPFYFFFYFYCKNNILHIIIYFLYLILFFMVFVLFPSLFVYSWCSISNDGLTNLENAHTWHITFTSLLLTLFGSCYPGTIIISIINNLYNF